MTNLREVKRKPIKVVLADGKEREIKFTLNTMAELEDKYGSVDAAFKALEKGSIKAIRTFLWAAMEQDDNALSEKQIGALINMDNMSDIMDAIKAATDSDMPTTEEVGASVVATVEGTVVSDPN